ncbi:MAG: hypothetical protein CM1200mP39_05820 [Dehalococcoidia bacterium]|nr:MAG: hypothetical protein CM1200mP39_05820 [Dehalococcoidia bacterium]
MIVGGYVFNQTVGIIKARPGHCSAIVKLTWESNNKFSA